eukprot:TRINITY_DN4514_c2_g1_i2.p1 TRINITY_DN4514_c2_g1~~TRINITY_DN4514_c2_g1_i2.p1  ORF type:complete len:683 (-),score=155.56 TRINITY_DN4514_c2_g1_i2:88-2115(-)
MVQLEASILKMQSEVDRMRGRRLMRIPTGDTDSSACSAAEEPASHITPARDRTLRWCQEAVAAIDPTEVKRQTQLPKHTSGSKPGTHHSQQLAQQHLAKRIETSKHVAEELIEKHKKTMALTSRRLYTKNYVPPPRIHEESSPVVEKPRGKHYASGPAYQYNFIEYNPPRVLAQAGDPRGHSLRTHSHVYTGVNAHATTFKFGEDNNAHAYTTRPQYVQVPDASCMLAYPTGGTYAGPEGYYYICPADSAEAVAASLALSSRSSHSRHHHGHRSYSPHSHSSAATSEQPAGSLRDSSLYPRCNTDRSTETQGKRTKKKLSHSPTKSSALRATQQPLVKCQNCEQEQACLRCIDCNQMLCRQCWYNLHLSATKKRHKVEKFSRRKIEVLAAKKQPPKLDYFYLQAQASGMSKQEREAFFKAQSKPKHAVQQKRVTSTRVSASSLGLGGGHSSGSSSSGSDEDEKGSEETEDEEKGSGGDRSSDSGEEHSPRRPTSKPSGAPKKVPSEANNASAATTPKQLVTPAQSTPKDEQRKKEKEKQEEEEEEEEVQQEDEQDDSFEDEPEEIRSGGEVSDGVNTSGGEGLSVQGTAQSASTLGSSQKARDSVQSTSAVSSSQEIRESIDPAVATSGEGIGGVTSSQEVVTDASVSTSQEVAENVEQDSDRESSEGPLDGDDF